MKSTYKIKLIFILSLLSCLCFTAKNAHSQSKVDITNSTICVSSANKTELKKVVEVLQQEAQKRSNILWKTTSRLDKKNNPQIIVALENDKKSLPDVFLNKINKLENIGDEGFYVTVYPDLNKVLVLAENKRGALYGVGYLLRKMEISESHVIAEQSIETSSTPAYEIRGHQLGYRPKTNSYDAWSVAMFDQYIRDLAIFGANSIEIMPPRTDDDFTSKHMQLPAIEMIAEQSRICNEYDLDVWMWYPNMASNYTHPDTVQKEIEERHEVFSKLPRLDHLFVPGGDPGDLEPKILFQWMEKEAAILKQYHPNAKVWVSPQVFRPTTEWLDSFYSQVNKKPEWLGGVVFGPWIKTPLEDMRKIVRKDIPIRRYPDITHSLSSQYPIPQWDLAQAITLGRECINPRPTDEKNAHNALDQYANGSISYSEGTNDDVNKFVWSGQDWNPETPVIETLRDYAKYFIGLDYEEDVAQGLLAEEKSLQGSLLVNKQVQNTLYQWMDIEKRSSVKVKENFRFQMGLIRAYFDAYIQKRLLYETYLEQQAKEVLANYSKLGIDKAIEGCKDILFKASKEPIDQAYKLKCENLADDLFKSIGAQLTIEKHGAMGGRGNFMDNIDHPLNDAAWIFSKLSKIKSNDSESDKIAIIESIIHRTDPGTGGFYDNFGSPESWNRVIKHYDVSKDPGNLKTPRVSFGAGLKNEEWVHEITSKGFDGEAIPMAWMNQVTTLYDLPLEIAYDNLNPTEEYFIRVAYTGRFRSRIKMTADEVIIHDFIKTGIEPIYEFPIPAEIIKDGKITFSWTCGEAERGAQVTELWIIKK
ncbi:alpha-glucuronidase family glycosyl hydrolase [Reichenbachiella sp. MALMAid0571]|uniref:alpha-glucuronidase family glycosyl hydrolase n=1 Tax=Reichenbachiella sp. MALMAid0571 TaxID=3143939 RepID=UPI0032DE4445